MIGLVLGHLALPPTRWLPSHKGHPTKSKAIMSEKQHAQSSAEKALQRKFPQIFLVIVRAGRIGPEHLSLRVSPGTFRMVIGLE